MLRFLRFTLLAALVLAAAVQPRPANAEPAAPASLTLMVNSSLADAPDAAPGDGVCETAAGNGICTLRAAIMEANALPGADTVHLPPGTYTLTRTGYEDASLNGDLDITGDLTLIGADAETTLIDANGGVTQGRALQVLSGVTAYISGVCIQNGYGADDSGDDLGGGIRSDGSLTLSSTCVRNNHAVFTGGGIYNTGTLTIVDSFITNNTTNNYAGGIANYGSLVIITSAFSQNDGELEGGAIYAPSGSLRISGSRFNTNSAYSGGAVYVGPIDAVVENSVFYANTALQDGGAFQVNQGSLSLTNVTLSGNFARLSGGGLILLPGAAQASLYNVTIANNRADSDNNGTGDGGGIYRANDAGTLSMANSILANNALERGAGDLLDDCAGVIISQGFNLVRATAGCTLSGVNSGNKTAMDPLLEGLGSNGGPTPSLALMPGSPAIDAGNPAGCGDSLGAPLLFDQRGYFRHAGAAPARCDMGAYESGAVQPLMLSLPLVWR